MKRILFDIEGDGLLPELTKLHCIATVDVDTGEERVFGPTEIDYGLGHMAAADVLIAHFGLGYDFPALEKLYSFHVEHIVKLDTVVIARLKYPNIKELDSGFNKTLMARGEEPMGQAFGAHTIEAWGRRLGVPKLHTDITDWSVWTQEIQDRCVGDVRTNLKLWQYLDPDSYSQDAIELEHRTQRLCNKITAAGWPFNVEKAGKLHAHLVEEKAETEKKLVADFGGWWAPKKAKKIDRKELYAALGKHLSWLGPVKKIPENWQFPIPFIPKRDNAKMGYVAGAPCTQIEWVTFNPASRQHIERCLRKLGWKPDEFTDNGQAKLDEEILDSVASEFPEAQGLTKFLMLDKRIGQLATGNQAWLTKVKEDGRIHGSYNPMGTVTSRAAHFDPNIGQVPASSSPYGHECRELFEVPEGYEQLGADMSGLEGRCLAHYLAKHDGGAYGEVLLKGDPHWAVVRAVGFLDCPRDKEYALHDIVRNGAKRLFYAMLYGAGAEKAGRIIIETSRAARKANPDWGFLYTKFFGDDEAPGPRKLQRAGSAAKRAVVEGIPGFERLMSSITGREYLPGLDKRRVPVRSDHAALNTLLQSAGAILCKRWICDAYDALLAAGFVWGQDFWFLGWIHDELQIACRKGTAERVGAIVTEAARNAGTPYGFRLALDSEFKVGRNWAETH